MTTAKDLLTLAERGVGLYESRKEAAEHARAQVNQLTENVNLLTLTELTLSQLLTEVSRENLQAIEQTITYGLRTVFDDLRLGFKFKLGQRGNVASIEPMLVDESVGTDFEAPITEAFGGGPAQVVAFLLRLIVCYRLGLYPVVLLDEVFSMVSAKYVANVAKLLKELAAQLKIDLLVVTHQDGFTEHADVAYQVAETANGTTFTKLAGPLLTL